MALFDLLGRRWALRVIWELSQETLSFRALRERCDSMSTSVLNERLSELREAPRAALAARTSAMMPSTVAAALRVLSSRLIMKSKTRAARGIILPTSPGARPSASPIA